MRTPPPCGKFCPKRKPGCQSSCEEYKQWEAKMKKIKSKINKEKELYWIISKGR